MMGPMHALVFAGQGAEMPGMGIALAERSPRARQLLALASDAVALDLPRAMESGARALERTEVLQPALVAIGLGAAYLLEERVGLPSVALGHSLGELTAALYARGVTDERAIAIARARGEAMAEAARRAPGGMLATSGGEAIAAAAASFGVSLAAENAPDEVVYAGTLDGLRALAKSAGAGSRMLRVGGPWHAPSMATAGPALEAALAGALGARRCALVTATTGTLAHDVAAIESALVRGLSMPVRFTRALLAARGATDKFVAPCPGRLMRTLVRRNLDLGAHLLDDLADLDAAERELRA